MVRQDTIIRTTQKGFFAATETTDFIIFCLDRQIGWKKKKKSLLGTIDKT